MLQGAKNLFRTSAAEAPAAAGARAGPGEEGAEGSDRSSAGEACSSAAPGGVATLPQDQVQRASSLFGFASASSASGPTIKRTSSLDSSTPPSSDPFDPFPRSSSELGGKKKATVMWQRAMRKSATEVPAALPAEGAGVGLSSSDCWLDEAAAATSRYAAAAPIGGGYAGWGTVRESVASAPLATFKIGELMLALRRQQAGADFMRAKIAASPNTRRARMARWASREEP